jgi:uncharacterized membrane protein YgcG
MPIAMNAQEITKIAIEPGVPTVILPQKSCALILCISHLLATTPAGYAYQGNQPPAPPSQPAKQTPQQLQQLVAPIALYPDALVAQILAAATYPTEIVEADRWVQQNSKLKGKKLADEVNKQSWDPSVKALAQFPSVLANMDKNLSWASSLGQAYADQQSDVMDAVQVMRSRAQKAGNLKSSSQEKVTTQGKTIVIEPANPDVVYVPQFDPWLVYGAPVVGWPGWYPYPGLFIGGPGIAFGVGLGIGFFGGFAWGWHSWGFDWGHRAVMFNHSTYISHSTTIINHNNFHGAPGGFDRGAGFHGGAVSHSNFGTHSGAFGGFNHGGDAMRNSFRGRSSFGGGFHGGGFHGGGGRP